MRREHKLMPLGMVLLALGALSFPLLACIFPSFLARTSQERAAGPTLPPTSTIAPTATPQPGTPAATVSRISEQDMNQWLQGAATHLGEEIECQDLQAKIQREGIVLSAKVRLARLADAQVPMDVELRPVVHDGGVSLEVLDVRLGEPYASLSSLIKPLVVSGISESIDANKFLADQGVRVLNIELQDGYMIVTSVPAHP